MPRGKSKKRNDNSNLRNSVLMSKVEYGGMSDDDSMNDNASVISSLSGSIICEDTLLGEELTDQIQETDVFEGKLEQAIEGLSEKSAQNRITSIESVTAALMKRFIPEFVIRRRMSINDAIEKSLKKGRGNEQAAAAQLAALLVVQLGSTEFVDEVCQCLIPTLLSIVGDSSMTCAARAKCCWAVSLLAFIGNYEGVDEVMDTLRQTFKTTVNPNCSGDETLLYMSAISAWCLLLTVASSTDSFLIYLKQVIKLLDSNSVDIRMAVGEVIAVVLEQMKDFDSADEWEPDVELLSKLKELATDSHKFRAKKDRKTQRSVFRDIIRYIEEREFPKMQVRFGNECLSLDTWCRKKQYDVFRQALGSGMNLHLKENDLLRDILNLGEKIPVSSPIHKQSKLERHLMNAAAFKARSICRAKHRDKKSISAS